MPINWGLIRNPLNWLTVILMMTLAGFVVDAIARWNTTRKT